MMRKRAYILLLLLFIAACNNGKKQVPSSVGNIAAVDSLVIDEIEHNHIPGAVLRIQKGDSILHQKAYGHAQKYDFDLKKLENPEPMTTAHLFDLASLTKVFGTTFGIMILVDDGKINLNDPIYKWLPEFNSGEKRKITIRHLLTHSAGLYQWKPTYYHASNKEEQYDYIAKLPLKWSVGEARHYSDLGFMLLGEIIERISGKRLDAYLEEELFRPLDLRNTSFNPIKKGFANIAATSHGNVFERHMVYDSTFGYDVDVDPKSWDKWRKYTLRGEVNDGNAWYATGGVAGHAGLFSTADDLQKLVSLLLQKGEYDGKQIISASVIDTFLTQNEFNNGLGWAMDPDVISAEGAPPGTFGHTGFTGTNVVIIPVEDLSIILLTNRQNVGVQPSGYYFDLSKLRQQILNTVLNNLGYG